MGLEVYYPQDIRNVLLAAEQASNSALTAAKEKNDEFAQGYQAGYRAALTTVALAFGLIPGPDDQGPSWPETRYERHDWQPVYLPTRPWRNGKNGRG